MWIQHQDLQTVPFPYSPGCCGISKCVYFKKAQCDTWSPHGQASSICSTKAQMKLWGHCDRCGCAPGKAACRLQASYHFICLKTQFYTPFHFANEMLFFKPGGLPARQSSNYAWAVSSCAHLESLTQEKWAQVAFTHLVMLPEVSMFTWQFNYF